MGDLTRRIEALERAYSAHDSGGGRGPGGGQRERLAYKFVSVALTAISHIRREVLDLPQFRYRLDMLHEFSTFKTAAYVAALTRLGHEDEEKAREILLEKPGGDSETLEKLIAIVKALGRRTT
jgi:hypothetical protein